MAWWSLLAAAPLLAQLEAPETARVVTGQGLPSACLAPFEVTRVDGVASAVPAHGFDIEPGLHAFNGRALLDTRLCPVAGDNWTMPPAQDLEIMLEAGKTYYVAYDHGSPNTADWSLVVWKVETGNESGDEPVDAPEGVPSEERLGPDQ